MADYTPNPYILDGIAANREWMTKMMDGMPTECLQSCAEEIKCLRAELAKRTEERDAARREICGMLELATNDPREEHAKFWGWNCFRENTNG